MNSEWIELDREILTAAYLNNFKSIPSPYDIPKAIRLNESEDGGLLIELSYIPNREKRKLVDSIAGVQLEVGENSRKIYKVLISNIFFRNLGSSGQEAINMTDFEPAIDRFISQQERYSNNTQKYSLTKEALSSQPSYFKSNISASLSH